MNPNPQVSEKLSGVSALFDGELEPHEVMPAVRAAAHDETAREAWQTYALIGDQLRGESHAAADITAAVMARVREEPVVLAPRNLSPVSRPRPLLALAASVAGVAVVGWLALAGTPGSSVLSGNLAAVAPAPTFSSAGPAVALAQADARRSAAVPGPAVRADMSEYLLAHHTQSSSFRFGDGTQQVRTVSLVTAPARP
ncbi:MAG: sigma-E factor negative regulatory protein [Rhodocyclaceae bacterium]|nr:sigma-E factor negative regulatory protein [Rhodocyclaceae bacterium]